MSWEFWIDRGGTFTDIVARDPHGDMHTHKLLSEHPRLYSDAAIQGMRDLLGIAPGQALDTSDIAAVKMGTTVATNALLEREGEPTVLVTTKGFADALQIGYQARPDIFALDIVLPEMLYSHVIEVDERLGADGKVLTPLDLEQAHTDLLMSKVAGFNSVAIAFMHGYRHTAHEAQVAAVARELGFAQVSVSHEVSPLMKLVSRGDTTVVDAYLSPVLRRYVQQVDAELRPDGAGPRLLFMQSNGGLTDAHDFQGKDALLSGPAGGVVGMVRTAEAAGFDKLIGFDMGGTSTDVSHFAGELERSYETEVAGVRVRAPMMHIHTVAAGGGSILHFDGARMRVGPDSAGADPGPACYGNGGPLAITDCNVVLGKLRPEFFPAVFGSDGTAPLDVEASRVGFEVLAAEIEEATATPTTVAEIAEGFLAIAVENMANAIKKISVQKGYDVTDYALVCFGGAGGQHACLVADRLGISTVLVHPYAGVLSAVGIGLADVRHVIDSAVEANLSPGALTLLDSTWKQLEAEGVRAVRAQGIEAEQILTTRRLALRYVGSDTALQVSAGDETAVRVSFAEVHLRRFGFVSPDKDLVIESIQVETVGAAAESSIGSIATNHGGNTSEVARFETVMAGGHSNTPFLRRSELGTGAEVAGPAVIVEETGTTIVEPEWRATVSELGDLVLQRSADRSMSAGVGTKVDPVQLEIFNLSLIHI